MICKICGSVNTEHVCPNRKEIWHLNNEKELADIERTKISQHLPIPNLKDVGEHSTVAIRNPVNVRYDVIYAEFLRMMAKIGAVGAEKYGDLNWHKSRLTGANSPINHIHKHLVSYELREKYDHKEIGEDYKIHLAAIAFNAMMEYWYCENLVEPTKMNNFDSYKAITTPDPLG